jgi:hypothetical protein
MRIQMCTVTLWPDVKLKLGPGSPPLAAEGMQFHEEPSWIPSSGVGLFVLEVMSLGCSVTDRGIDPLNVSVTVISPGIAMAKFVWAPKPTELCMQESTTSLDGAFGLDNDTGVPRQYEAVRVLPCSPGAVRSPTFVQLEKGSGAVVVVASAFPELF